MAGNLLKFMLKLRINELQKKSCALQYIATYALKCIYNGNLSKLNHSNKHSHLRLKADIKVVTLECMKLLYFQKILKENSCYNKKYTNVPSSMNPESACFL